MGYCFNGLMGLQSFEIGELMSALREKHSDHVRVFRSICFSPSTRLSQSSKAQSRRGAKHIRRLANTFLEQRLTEHCKVQHGYGYVDLVTWLRCLCVV